MATLDTQTDTDSDTEAELGKQQRQTSTDTVYLKIRSKILDNEFRPGMQVLEQELVKLFGVSRTPVREALIRLQNESLVEIIPRHGMRVRQVSISDMEEIYQILTSLEATAAELATMRSPSAGELKPFEDACVEMERALVADDLEAWAAADEAFHLHLLKLCGNGRIEGIVRKYWDQIHRARYITLRLGPKPHDSVVEHRAIIEAMRRGDADAAGSLFREHRTHGVRKQIDTLKRFRLYEV
jgi:DNA-binding GntR family transcriptional regulator